MNGFGKRTPGEIDLRVPPQERAHLVLRSEELPGRFAERSRAPRGRMICGAFCLNRGLHGRFEHPDEPPTHQPRSRRSTSSSPLRQRALSGGLHRAQIDAVGGRQMIEAFRHAPRPWRRPARHRVPGSDQRPALARRAPPRRKRLPTPRCRVDGSPYLLPFHTLGYGDRGCQYPAVWRESIQ